MRRRLVAAMCAALVLAAIGAIIALATGGSPMSQPGYFPPPPHAPGQAMLVDQAPTINLSPSTPLGEQFGARVMPGGTVSPQEIPRCS
jgi:hypothetical protein